MVPYGSKNSVPGFPYLFSWKVCFVKHSNGHACGLLTSDHMKVAVKCSTDTVLILRIACLCLGPLCGGRAGSNTPYVPIRQLGAGAVAKGHKLESADISAKGSGLCWVFNGERKTMGDRGLYWKHLQQWCECLNSFHVTLLTSYFIRFLSLTSHLTNGQLLGK